MSEKNLANKAQVLTPKQQSKEFMKFFEADKKRLYAYIYAYVMDHSAAEDIFQETSMVLWREFHRFDQQSNFTKWANGIAFNRIRDYRYKSKKYVLGLSDDFLQEFNNLLKVKEQALKEDKPNRWLQLQDCSKQLPDPMRRVYDYFYVQNLKAQQVAENTGRSVYAIRKAVHKLRKMLFDCVEKKQHGEPK